MPRLFQLVLALSLALCGTPLHAAPAREPAPMPFRVAAVEGKAMLVKPGRGEVKHLEPDVVMEEGHTFITLADGQVTVLLPNGTPLVIGPNSRLSVTAFRMNPPDAPVKGLGRLHKEPSQSQTHLILSHGTLCLSVKILNRGSAFLLETPVASLPLEEIALNVAVPLQKEPATDAYLAGLASVYAATPTPGDRGSAGAILPENLLVSPPKPQRGVFSLLKGALDMKWGEEKQIEVLPGDELVILTQGDLANNVQVSKEILAGSRRAKFEQMLSEGTGFFEVATPTKVERTDAASRAAATRANRHMGYSHRRAEAR